MSKRRRGRNDGPVRYVRLEYWLLKTDAWKSLNSDARAIYIELKFRYNGSNNGRIPYSIREAAETLAIGKSTAARALVALEDRGFIAEARKGMFDRKARHASEWRLTEHMCDIDIDIPHKQIRIQAGSLATKEFTRWHPRSQAKTQKPVPVVGLTVPVAGPIGTFSGTETLQKRRYGT